MFRICVAGKIDSVSATMPVTPASPSNLCQTESIDFKPRSLITREKDREELIHHAAFLDHNLGPRQAIQFLRSFPLTLKTIRTIRPECFEFPTDAVRYNVFLREICRREL